MFKKDQFFGRRVFEISTVCRLVLQIECPYETCGPSREYFLKNFFSHTSSRDHMLCYFFFNGFQKSRKYFLLVATPKGAETNVERQRAGFS